MAPIPVTGLHTRSEELDLQSGESRIHFVGLQFLSVLAYET